MNVFGGRMLVRKAKTPEGKTVLVLTGVFLPPEGLDIDDKDEQWFVKLAVLESIRYTNADGTNFSPEDYLISSGVCRWEPKTPPSSPTAGSTDTPSSETYRETGRRPSS